jgi:hypothetical protein
MAEEQEYAADDYEESNERHRNDPRFRWALAQVVGQADKSSDDEQDA